MADSARLTHVSPGIYQRETELTYAVKSLGITTLGLVGETQRGPAFQPMAIENWRDFTDVFGGTSAEKFRDSQYPKYELPYIAKSYLSESNQLQVCRVLGLSGYHAGPAWCITASGDESEKSYLVAIIRSRATYSKYASQGNSDDCACVQNGYDALNFMVGEVRNTVTCSQPKQYEDALRIGNYKDFGNNASCKNYALNGELRSDFSVSTSDYGHFSINGWFSSTSAHTTSNKDVKYDFTYSVSLNQGDPDYILNVLGTNPYEGDSPLFVESLYDISYEKLISEGTVTKINSALTYLAPFEITSYSALEEADDFLTKPQESLRRSDYGKRYIFKADYSEVSADTTNYYYIYPNTNTVATSAETTTGVTDGKPYSSTTLVALSDSGLTEGQVYKVSRYDGKYVYAKYCVSGDAKYNMYSSSTQASVRKVCVSGESASGISGIKMADRVLSAQNDVFSASTETDFSRYGCLIQVKGENGKYFRMVNTSSGASAPTLEEVTLDLNNYKEPFRYASTPWFVSNVKGDANRIELSRLFRFHTISDGNSANNEIKISITNVNFDKGTFKVQVRAIDDIDAAPQVLESFSDCSLVSSSKNYIGYKIGTFDGVYESKSKYITVEVNENGNIYNSVPCGYLGYPLNVFEGGVPVNGQCFSASVKSPIVSYNTEYDVEVKARKQYFGLSDLTGVDLDLFSYKGVAAYGEDPKYLSVGFHLDSRLALDSYETSGKTSGSPIVTVDGVEGYEFVCVSPENRTDLLDGNPIIGREIDMQNCIYQDEKTRKFTAYFYGGFDGWDIYRGSRSNTDDFRLSSYKGTYNKATGVGYSFDRIKDPAVYGLNQSAISSDWYAYLSAARQFANPEETDINVFATPGIDLINNKTLCQEIIEMLEEERADSIYVATLPDKPFGASDFIDEMYTPEEIVGELEDTDIESNYTCTYYPWIKYEDTDNNQYIYLPPTKDVVRNMAVTDNTSYPWFAPAGLSRGDVYCARAHYVTKLADEDVLYEGRINPVKTFASDGVKIWGQKNLQHGDAQLTRIAVRRLLLRMRKLVAVACLGLIFEPNDATTKAKFLSTVTPIMDNIRANRGISDYRIEVDDSVEARDRRELPAKIFFKPYHALEYIVLDFVVTPEGLDFDAI